MIATPIPRTLAVILYADLDISNIVTKPVGRLPIKNAVIEKKDREKAYLYIKKQIEKGHQVFIVTPAVQEKAKSASVERTAKILTRKFTSLKIEYVHGGLDKNQQNKKIEEFRDRKSDVLIASSIIEVGIDIPNATVMLVLDAHRFGASSLHQIRGRVCRGKDQGYCYLVSEADT